MITTAYVGSALIAAAILFIGSRFHWAPTVAARDFGMAGSPPLTPAFAGWLATKGTRDMVSGLVVVLLMVNGSPRLLGEFLLLASLIPISDAISVLRSGGSRAAAVGIHGATALFLVAVALTLILASR